MASKTEVKLLNRLPTIQMEAKSISCNLSAETRDRGISSREPGPERGHATSSQLALDTATTEPEIANASPPSTQQTSSSTTSVTTAEATSVAKRIPSLLSDAPPTAEDTEMPSLAQGLKYMYSKAKSAFSLGDTEDYSVTLVYSSPKLWKFPGTMIYVGRETDVPLPKVLTDRWPQIKVKLLNNLGDIDQVMMAEQSKEKDAAKRHYKRRMITLELRMSGHRGILSETVTISPCIWILCGSKWCRNKVRAATKCVDLPVNLFSQTMEVHHGGPAFSAVGVQPLVPHEQLEHDAAMDSGAFCEGGIILHHIEGSAHDRDHNSVCGKLCCTTFMRHGGVVEQHVSRIGGVLTHEFFNCDHKISPLAITTAHGIFDLIWLHKSNERCSTSIESDMERLSISFSEHNSVSCSDSESDDDVDQDSQLLGDMKQLGRRNSDDVSTWTCIEDVVGINFMWRRFSGEGSSEGEAKPADYTILRSNLLEECRNIVRSIPEIEITTYTANSDLKPGPISVILDLDDISEASLLPGTIELPLGDSVLAVRKIELVAPLAPGISGTWVTRGSSFCGMIVAIYPGEPLALFMTAEDLLRDMEVSYPEIQRPLISESSTSGGTQPIPASRAKTPPATQQGPKLQNNEPSAHRDNSDDGDEQHRPIYRPIGSSKKNSSRPVYVWTCCQCGDSGMRIEVNPSCPNCHYHTRCSHCPVDKVKVKKSTRTSGGSPGGPITSPN